VDKSKSEYKFPVASSKEKPISTSKALKLRFGKNEKVFPMYLVSDSRPTDEDVKKYESVQKSSRQDVLGKREALRLRKKQDELVNNYTYTEADIAMNVAERKKTGKAPKNLGLEQTRVAIAVQAAQSAVDDAQRKVDDAKRAYLEASENDSDELEKAMEEAQTALAEAKSNLEEKKDEEQRLLAIVERRKEKLTRRQNWQKVNERAAKMNQTADFQSYKDQQAKKEAESMSGSAPRFNPYARRRVKPKILWEVGQKEEKKDDDATKTSDNEARDEADEAVKAANAKDDQQMTEAPQEDILGSQKLIDDRHQFSIDEEALTPDTTSFLGTSRKKQKVSRTRRGLSLADYQKQKSAGTL
jgi:RNA polymerase-associated protein RTF1